MSVCLIPSNLSTPSDQVTCQICTNFVAVKITDTAPSCGTSAVNEIFIFSNTPFYKQLTNVPIIKYRFMLTSFTHNKARPGHSTAGASSHMQIRSGLQILFFFFKGHF